mmetsp:Transcript_108959/g.307077  ORF Transcript_108959/g.307077 Transcript_108959/m.307077 type:complete len:223 (+) Transcript_108959:533-1201(+)
MQSSCSLSSSCARLGRSCFAPSSAAARRLGRARKLASASSGRSQCWTTCVRPLTAISCRSGAAHCPGGCAHTLMSSCRLRRMAVTPTANATRYRDGVCGLAGGCAGVCMGRKLLYAVADAATRRTIMVKPVGWRTTRATPPCALWSASQAPRSHAVQWISTTWSWIHCAQITTAMCSSFRTRTKTPSSSSAETRWSGGWASRARSWSCRSQKSRLSMVPLHR